jgi:hypothetical protein
MWYASILIKGSYHISLEWFKLLQLKLIGQIDVGISLMSNLMSVMSNVNAADIPKTGTADHLIFVYCSSEAI